MSKPLEKPFEYLKRKDKSSFSDEMIKNWYRARAFVLDRLKDVAFKTDEKNHLHVVLNDDSDLMLSVARQVALSAHYINYDEENEKEEERNRTVITIVSSKSSEAIFKALKDESCLCNLLDHCKYQLFDAKPEHEDSYIDVEFSIVRDCPTIDPKNPNEILIEENEVISYCNSKFEDEIYSIDTSKAQYADRMYNLGTLIENLPAENIHDASRYSLALDVFQFDRLREPLRHMINDAKWKEDQIKVKNGLSNVICADCFETRVKEIKKTKEAAIENCQTAEAKKREKKVNYWEKCNEPLSKSEHARWVVEKLIMGFRPLNEKERLEDENLSSNKKKRKEFRNGMKKNAEVLAHIDLCSYRDLRRINPEDMKYDSFLMLAIPKILERINHEDE